MVDTRSANHGAQQSCWGAKDSDACTISDVKRLHVVQLVYSGFGEFTPKGDLELANFRSFACHQYSKDSNNCKSSLQTVETQFWIRFEVSAHQERLLGAKPTQLTRIRGMDSPARISWPM